MVYTFESFWFGVLEDAIDRLDINQTSKPKTVISYRFRSYTYIFSQSLWAWLQVGLCNSSHKRKEEKKEQIKRFTIPKVLRYTTFELNK